MSSQDIKFYDICINFPDIRDGNFRFRNVSARSVSYGILYALRSAFKDRALRCRHFRRVEVVATLREVG